jgi:hypothetical protein
MSGGIATCGTESRVTARFGGCQNELGDVGALGFPSTFGGL